MPVKWEYDSASHDIASLLASLAVIFLSIMRSDTMDIHLVFTTIFQICVVPP
jgi:hypothetical protein